VIEGQKEWNEKHTKTLEHKVQSYVKNSFLALEGLYEKPDKVNHPEHYTHGGIETIDYLQAKMTQEQFEGYLVGNILKYVSRYPHKNGIEDLRKAQWYLNKLVVVKEDETK
jgi:hypothetical protein